MYEFDVYFTFFFLKILCYLWKKNNEFKCEKIKLEQNCECLNNQYHRLAKIGINGNLVDAIENVGLFLSHFPHCFVVQDLDIVSEI